MNRRHFLSLAAAVPILGQRGRIRIPGPKRKPYIKGLKYTPATGTIVNGKGIGGGGNEWWNEYADTTVRDWVEADWDFIRANTPFNTLVFSVTRDHHFDWPTPTAAQLTAVSGWVNLAATAGFKSYILCANQCLTRSSVDANHIYNTQEGAWASTECVDPQATNVSQGVAWWDAICDELSTNVTDLGNIAGLSHAGDPIRAYMTEMNGFRNGYSYSAEHQAWFDSVWATMRDNDGGFPVGMHLPDMQYDADEADQYSGLTNIVNTLEAADGGPRRVILGIPGRFHSTTYDFTTDWSKAITYAGGDRRKHNILIEDCKLNDIDVGYTVAQAMANYVSAVETHGLAGLYIWEYRTHSSSFEVYNGSSWDSDVLDALA